MEIAKICNTNAMSVCWFFYYGIFRNKKYKRDTKQYVYQNTMTQDPILDHQEHTHMLTSPSKEIHRSVPYDGHPRSFSER